MKKSELRHMIKEIIEEIIQDKLEDKVEAMFYRTLFESNLMPNMVGTIVEKLVLPESHTPIALPTVAVKESVTFSEPVTISETIERKTEPTEILSETLKETTWFEGTQPLVEGESVGIYEGNISPDLIKHDGLDLGIFESVSGAWKHDMNKMKKGD